MADEQKKLGRPPRPISQELIDNVTQYALDGCYTKTIARLVGEPESFIRDHFQELITQKRAERKLNLLRAMNGDASTTMLIWRSKNELDWTDKQRVDTNATIKLYGQEAPVDEV